MSKIGFTYTMEGVARLFLRRFDQASDEDARACAGLMRDAYLSALRGTVDEAIRVYKELHHNECRNIPSCDCFICQLLSAMARAESAVESGDV